MSGDLANSVLNHHALQLMQNMASDAYLKASTNITDNYNRVWARDAAVGSLAILCAEQTELYPAISNSLLLLHTAANSNGQIPSNVAVDEHQQLKHISFGSNVGRTDAGFWWVIATVLFLNKQPQDALASVALTQTQKIFQLADIWEFNGKHLMYVPMSSNWADEYITNGYVLYDQLLRYWALELAAHYWQNEEWKQKAGNIKLAIKKHFLIEAETNDTLFTSFQQLQLQQFDISKQFIASFSPGQIVYRYDGWSIALSLLLDIPSATTQQKLISVLQQIIQTDASIGIPAFWPTIQETDADYTALLFNHHYRFKNNPGHFHNGGVWPVVNGFMIMALQLHNETTLATTLNNKVCNALHANLTTYPFAEYFHPTTGMPGGVSNLCFSASGIMLAHQCLQNTNGVSKCIKPFAASNKPIHEQVIALAKQVKQYLHQTPSQIICIAIAGESGCGKTTLAQALKTLFEAQQQKVVLLHQDNYFKLPPHQNHQARLANFEHIGTQEVDFNLLNQHINTILQQQAATIDIPVMDWQTDTCVYTSLPIHQTRVIIVEGTYTMLLQAATHKLFITTNYKQTRNNRIGRNRETVTDFIERVLEKESRIIQKHASMAQIWINENMEVFTQQPA